MVRQIALRMILLISSVSVWNEAVLPTLAQNTNPNETDPRLSLVIQNALAASGGASAVGSVRDFRQSGEITYNLGRKPREGTVVISGVGATDLRFDVTIDGDDRRWYVSGGQGKSIQKGTTSRLPYHAGINRGAITLPILKLMQQATSLEFRISYIGIDTSDGRELHHLRAERISPSSNSYEQSIAALEKAEYFLDSQTFLIVRMEDIARPPENQLISQRHVLEYADYRNIHGVQIPFSIVEHIENAQTWSLKVTEVNFNLGLTQSDIQF